MLDFFEQIGKNNTQNQLYMANPTRVWKIHSGVVDLCALFGLKGDEFRVSETSLFRGV